ncbi:hypothetical protein EBB79_07235 [Parasedimentitalea marina]|uniref:HD family hydrolase n=1 Tax=Parasedimentitalea marina TaxID=2483033 RepID=A0A3T0N103_9RHOB|nr:hypothetical protein [Parasedimentitalea marina]AZV77703.1 hypothetical protein EBB79_07235 [Parasedimentitalea marina]
MNEKVKHIVGPTIALHSGSYFDFEDPESSNFTIDDVAHGLSQICRFTGQCKRFYSVAEHSVHASHNVPAGFEMEALMHDAPEAFVGDISKPLKTLLPDYKIIEDRAEAVVLARFGITPPLSPQVKLTDLKMLRAEQVKATGNQDVWPIVAELNATDITLEFWQPEEAKRRFLERFYELST